MRLDDCSEFSGHRLKNCSRCGHQFDALKLTRLNCDELNAIKDKESQFGFRWKLSDWAVGEVVKVDVCPSCYASVVNLINTNEMIENLERNKLRAKQLNDSMCKCQICHKELPKNGFRNIPHYITSDILTNPDDYFVEWSRSEKQDFIDLLSESAYVKTVKVCPQCFDGLYHEYRHNEVQRLKKTACPDPDFLAKQLNIPMRLCPFCNEHKPKGDFYKVPDHVVHSFVMRSTIYTRDKKQTQQFLNSIYSPDGPMVCSDCVAFMNERFGQYFDTEDHKLPVYVDGEYQGEVYAEPYRVDMADVALYAYEKLKNERKINKFKLEERKMKNVNETKNENHAFAIERNYDETDRKLFRLEDTETGDFIRLATDEDRLIYMVVNIAPVKNRVKVNEKSGSNCVWCVCIQTQDLVELNGDEMVYVYDPRYIAFRIGRFIDA